VLTFDDAGLDPAGEPVSLIVVPLSFAFGASPSLMLSVLV